MELPCGRGEAADLFRNVDLILPAIEDAAILAWLHGIGTELGVPVAVDLDAYAVSSSKLRSNELFAKADIPLPEPWPACGFPVILKPSDLSGSAGVGRADTPEELEALLRGAPAKVVIQKFVQGPSYSLEVLGHRGDCVGLVVTELHFDAGYDCKRVVAGPATGGAVAEELRALGCRIGAALGLSGIMDVEVIAGQEGLRVLEIDARLPSQTPTAVYHATGINMVALLADYWVKGRLPALPSPVPVGRGAVCEHLRFRNAVLEVTGEHALAGARGLQLLPETWGAEAVLSNCRASPGDWVATAVFTGATEAYAWRARAEGIEAMRRDFGVSVFRDLAPGRPGGAS